MRTNFLPNLQMNPLAIAQMGAGVAQGIFGAIQAGKAQKQLNKLQAPQYKQNQSIMDFYNEALKRYNVSPTDSAMYKRQMQGVDRNVAAGLNSLQDRRSGIAGVSSILRAGNDAALNANVAAEAERSNRFGQLGSAAGMKAGEDDKAFQFNQYMPFERKYNLLSQKAGGGNQIMNAGISNIFGGLQGWNQMNMIDKMYPKK
jgi:hypothetical protein